MLAASRASASFAASSSWAKIDCVKEWGDEDDHDDGNKGFAKASSGVYRYHYSCVTYYYLLRPPADGGPADGGPA
jgi:hypothetical protein